MTSLALQTKCTPGLNPTDDSARLYARFVASATSDAVPAEVRTRARHHLLDAIGIAFVSGKFDFSHRALTAALMLADSGGTAPVIGLPTRLPMRDAALINGILCHGLDFDDTHTKGVIHPTASIFPTILAAGVKVGASVEEAILCYVLGVEVATRIASVAQGGFHQVGFHPTGLAGVFGCALAAGRLFGLSETELVHAQGIALSFASGSMEFLEEGAWTKRLHPGWAAQAGLAAAAHAKHGFTGPRYPYCGRFGLYNAYLGREIDGCDIRLASEGLGTDWELLKTAIKPFPVCHLAHGAIDAALILRGAHSPNIEEIDRAEVLVPREIVNIVCEPVAAKRRPKSDYDARFSIQFLVAAALVRGRITLGELEPEALNDPRILSLADRVDYSIDPNSPFPRSYSGEVVLRTRDGGELRHREQVNRGAADRPLSAADIVQKYYDNVALAIGRRKAMTIEETVLRIGPEETLATFAEPLVG